MMSTTQNVLKEGLGSATGLESKDGIGDGNELKP